MEFYPVYHADRLVMPNPDAHVAVCTLWSPTKVVVDRLRTAGSLDQVAVVGTLYGNGFPQMLRNLVYNPQIQYLVLCGVDLGDSRNIINGFFQHGIEEVEFLGTPVYQVCGTRRKIDGNIQSHPIRVIDLGDKPTNEELQVITTLVPWRENGDRKIVSLPELVVTQKPSDIGAHCIANDTIHGAWCQLVSRIFRFGTRVSLMKGSRIELPTVKVCVRCPDWDHMETVSKDSALEYGRSLLNGCLPQDQHYSYGHRLRTYFGQDSLAGVIDRLRKDPESRHCYVTLWDARDLVRETGHPCLVSLFFRRIQSKLTLTATFRTHNVMTAWMMNVYGLLHVLQFVGDSVEMPVGHITIVSHSATIDVDASETAALVAENLEVPFAEDHRGSVLVSVDNERGVIVVDHTLDGQSLGHYEGETAEEMESILTKNEVLGSIAHALYVGRQLGRAEVEAARFRRRTHA